MDNSHGEGKTMQFTTFFTNQVVSPRKILTAASSSGSDPLASPSNEVTSDNDVQINQPSITTGLIRIPSEAASSGLEIDQSVDETMHVKLSLIEQQFQQQREMLSRQFEEQCHLLDKEQHNKMQQYLQQLVLKKHHNDIQLQRKLEEEQMLKIKNKKKTDESAVASSAVKQKLRQCLLSKQGISQSPPEHRQWMTQHGSLEQHSPPTGNKWSPPLHRYGDEYPLRKTVSEPSLKMKHCKMSLRQRVMQRNSQLIHKREMYRRRVPVALDHDSSPNSPPTFFQSQNSSIDMGTVKEEHANESSIRDIPRNADHQLSKTLSAGAYRPILCDSLSSTHYGSLPLVDGQYFQSAAGMTTLPPHSDTNPDSATIPSILKPIPSQQEPSSLTDAYVKALMYARSSLPRTRSEPIPLPLQLLLQQHLRQQEISQRDAHRYLHKHKLLQQASSKKSSVMENVDESAERQMDQDSLECSLDSEEDIDISSASSHAPYSDRLNSDIVPIKQKRRLMFDSTKSRTMSDEYAGDPNANRPSLERGFSCPVAMASVNMDDINMHQSQRAGPTGLAYDPLMLRHDCICQSNRTHPENPERIRAIWLRFEEAGLLQLCQIVKSRRAMKEELQTCHSEAYVHMYASSQKFRDPSVFEIFAPRFCQLPCGGVGVDSDTVWNDQETTMAARMAAGCAIELSYHVATGELSNGFAIVRPPGHHAEDTQAMGFCYFNSISIATKLLLEKLYLQRILIIDWDVHHGNSTQQLFYTDPRVLYISMHRHDQGNFFPGTGDPSECGIDRGLGYTVNIGFFGSTMGDAEYMAAFRSIVVPLAKEFSPEIIMVSAGFDAAAGHPAPLGGYNLSPQCYAFMTKELKQIGSGKLVLVLEGGYEIVPLCDAAEACLRILLQLPVDLPSDEELDRLANPSAVESMMNTIKYHISYWPCLASQMDKMTVSHRACTHSSK